MALAVSSGSASAPSGYPGLENDINSITQSFWKVIQDLRKERDALETERRQLQEEHRAMAKVLEKEWKAVEAEKEQLAKMRRRVDTVALDMAHKVKLNVGGTPYETTIETLTCDQDSMLAAMFSGKFLVDLQSDGSCFFDRDPKLFREVLLYLRWLRDSKEHGLDRPLEDAVVYSPMISEAEKDDLMREAQYFGIDSLVRLLRHNQLEVSCDVNAKYRRISEALQDARDGDIIIVKPGLYMDSFVLNRSVPIHGDGNRSEIIIRSAAGNVVESRSKGGVIRNLTLEVAPTPALLTPPPHGVAYGDHYCVLITAGSLVVENCEIRNAGLSCVKIVGDGDDGCPVIRGNAIHHANQCGILVTNKAGGLIEGND
eukprot:EG_transcript_16053